MGDIPSTSSTKVSGIEEKRETLYNVKLLINRDLTLPSEQVLSCDARERQLACKIILKIQLVENKEVTLLVELNW